MSAQRPLDGHHNSARAAHADGARGLAEFERELIRSRTGEGRARAKANGVRMGRPHKLTPHQQQEARRRRDAGESVTSIAKSYNVHHATISRHCAAGP